MSVVTPFAYEARWNPESGTHQGSIGATCAKCGKVEWAVAHSPGAGQRIFSRRGWRISATRAVCPDHSAGHGRREPANTPIAAALAPVLAAMINPTPAEEPAVAAEPPPSPTQAHNRLIFDALAEHYDEARGLYRKAFSDAAVAQALNLPRKWVETIRVQFYGPDTNEAALQHAADLDKAIGDAAKATDRLLAMAQEAETITAALKAQRAKLQGKAA